MSTPPFPARSTEPVAIEHVTAIPMGGGPVLPDHTVVIRDGLIEMVAPATAIDTTSMAIIDGRGRFLMPGLADMHVHFYDVSTTALFLANGVTTVRQMWGMPFHLAYRREVESGRLPGPRLTSTTPIIDGEGLPGSGMPGLAGAVCVTDAERAPRLVERLAARGYSQLKVYSQLAPEVFDALAGAARAVGMPVVGHCPHALTFEQAMAGGQRCFEHLMSIWNGHTGDDPVGFDGPNWLGAVAERLDLDSIHLLGQRMAVEDAWNCPTVVVWQTNWRTLEDLAGDPDLRWVPPLQRQSWDPRNDRGMQSVVEKWDERLVAGRKWRQALLDVVRTLHDAGAPLLVGSDCHNPSVAAGVSIEHELANFVAAGLTPMETLECATSAPARFLGEAHLWGSVAEGLRADLILLDENPLDDVRAASRPVAVFVNGFVLDRGALDELERYRLNDVERAAPDCEWDGGEHDVPSRQLVEEVRRVPTGHVCFSHRELPSGGFEVEEEYETTHSRLLVGRRRTRLRLTAAAEVETLTSTTDTGVGIRRVDVVREGDRYRVEVEDVDGFVRTSEAPAPLVPGATLSSTAAAIVARVRGEGPATVLEVEDSARTSTSEIKRSGAEWDLSPVGQPPRSEAVELGDDGSPVVIRTASEGNRRVARKFTAS